MSSKTIILNSELYRDILEDPLLNIIRDNLEQVPGFPSGFCMPTGKLADELSPRYLAVAGYCNSENSIGATHGWNYDSIHGVYIDLTLDQFDKDHPRIALISTDSPSHYATEGFNRFMANHTTDEIIDDLNPEKNPTVREFKKQVEKIRELVKLH